MNPMINETMQTMRVISLLMENHSGLITFSDAASIIAKHSGLPTNATDITRWFRDGDLLEKDSKEQKLTPKGCESGLLTQFEKAYHGKKRLLAGLTLSGLVFAFNNFAQIHVLKEQSRSKKGEL